MINSALILAAGIGSRLKGFNNKLPKSFLKIENEFIIDHSIKLLLKNNIKKIYIVTGYMHDFFYKYFKNNISIELIYNPFYSKYGSAYSLAEGLKQIKTDLLVLESDIFFDDVYIYSVLQSKLKNCLVTNLLYGSGDEVYVEAQKGKVINLSKKIDISSKIIGQFCGISKLDRHYIERMSKIMFKNKNFLKLDYESLILEAAKKHSLNYISLNSENWFEIDTSLDYAKMKKKLENKVNV